MPNVQAVPRNQTSQQKSQKKDFRQPTRLHEINRRTEISLGPLRNKVNEKAEAEPSVLQYEYRDFGCTSGSV